MKKLLILTTAFLILLSIAVYASQSEQIQAKKIQIPIKIDNTEAKGDIPMLEFDDKIYVHVRALCEILGMGIKWDYKESSIEILSGKERKFELDISKETAIKIADALFLQYEGEEFLKENDEVYVAETDDGKYLVVFRSSSNYDSEKDGLDGDYYIKIDKSNGRVDRAFGVEVAK
jgi:hypothetical protein